MGFSFVGIFFFSLSLSTVVREGSVEQRKPKGKEMKLNALQQQSRRSNSFRGSSTLDSSVDGAMKSPAAIFWLVLHGLCCLISLVLGFRFSRLVFFLLFYNSSTNTNLYSSSALRSATENIVVQSSIGTVSSTSVSPVANKTTAIQGAAASSRVVVGRHGILIRPWPHPNPTEVMRAHHIIERVQKEQRLQYGVKSPRTVIAITPTYVRTFQALHLTGVLHSLMNVPYDLVWIVVEAGGKTNETTSLIAKSGLRTIHVGFVEKMPTQWEDRHRLETRMRLHALRYDVLLLYHVELSRNFPTIVKFLELIMRLYDESES